MYLFHSNVPKFKTESLYEKKAFFFQRVAKDEIPKDVMLWESSLEHFPEFNIFH